MNKRTNTPANTDSATLPDGIEIFKVGTHTSDSGQVISFTEADIASMVDSYNPALREAPLCVGHPVDNKPAFGWVSGLQASGGKLLMNTKNVVPQFAEMVKQRLYKKRSASFYPPQHPSNPKPGNYYLRHVAFLGAQQPAIAGLADFADAENGVLCFSEADAESPNNPPQPPSVHTKEPPMTDTTKPAATTASADATALADAQARIAAAQQAQAAAEQAAKEAKEKLAEFAEKQAQQRTAEFAQFTEGLIKEFKMPPSDRAMTVAALNLAAGAKPVQFSEGNNTKTVDLLQWLKEKFQALKPIVAFGEHATAAGAGVTGLQKGASDEDVHKVAEQYMAQHKDVSYAEAVAAVISLTQ